MYDCYDLNDCLPPNSTNESRIKTIGDDHIRPHHRRDIGVGDPPMVGVARPADPTDPNLALWVKDHRNPIYFPGMRSGFAGPSNLWIVDGKVNMAMVLGRAVARFEALDPESLHNWTVVNREFLPAGGNNGHGSTGIMFFPLPGAVSMPSGPTHFLGGIWSYGHPKYQVGCPWFVLGRYDAVSGTFTNVTAAQPLDWSTAVMWSTIGQLADGRLIHVGWFNYGGTQCLTAPRVISYDPVTQKLLAMPAAELANLRGSPMLQIEKTTLPGGITSPLILPTDGSTAFDLHLMVGMRANSLSFTVAVLTGAEGANASVLIAVGVAAAKSGPREVNFTVTVPHASSRQAMLNTTATFALPSNNHPSFSLRILADRSIVESFAEQGRGVISTPVLAPGDQARKGVFLTPRSGELTVISATAWPMGCGWARYP